MTEQPHPNISPDLEAAHAEQARRKLRHFVKYAWRYADPQKFVDGWAVQAMCEHLEACASREIRNLLINIPPRHTKSLLTCALFPAWLWIGRPQERIMSISYGDKLAKRDSRLARQIMRSEWYRKWYGDSFKFTDDQNEKAEYENDHGGKRTATSIGGLGTGAGGSIIIVDDPHKADEINSVVARQGVLDWWNETMATRLDDPATGVQIVIMQRLHEGDLSGEILKDSGWEHLCLPARFEPERKCVTSIGWSDPRTEPGELLSPKRFNEDALAIIEKRLGAYRTAGQLQQRPAPIEGGIVKMDWWEYYTVKPGMDRIVISVDCGNKTKARNDPTVAQVWGRSAGWHYLLDEWRERVEFPGLKAGVKSLCAKWNPSAVLIEDAANGVSLIQQLPTEADFIWPIISITAKLDKVTRLEAASPTIEAGLVYLPEGAAWLTDFTTEVCTFPNATHDDRVDTLSQYLNWSRLGASRSISEILADVGGAGARESLDTMEEVDPLAGVLGGGGGHDEMGGDNW